MIRIDATKAQTPPVLGWPAAHTARLCVCVCCERRVAKVAMLAAPSASN